MEKYDYIPPGNAGQVNPVNWPKPVNLANQLEAIKTVALVQSAIIRGVLHEAPRSTPELELYNEFLPAELRITLEQYKRLLIEYKKQLPAKRNHNDMIAKVILGVWVICIVLIILHILGIL